MDPESKGPTRTFQRARQGVSRWVGSLERREEATAPQCSDWDRPELPAVYPEGLSFRFLNPLPYPTLFQHHHQKCVKVPGSGALPPSQAAEHQAVHQVVQCLEREAQVCPTSSRLPSHLPPDPDPGPLVGPLTMSNG